MTLGRRKRKHFFKLGAQPTCDVAGCFRETVQTGACHSGRRRLHNVGQITRGLSFFDVNIVHEGAELVGNSVTNW